jgi:rRNA-processing protein FCF1
MIDYFDELVKRYCRTGILLDTNILLLYFVGTFNEDEITRFNRTKMFTPEDYSTLVKILSRFDKIITTPNILTEVSNLSPQLEGHLKSSYFELFARRIAVFDEHYVPSIEIARTDEFKRFALTDAAIFCLAKTKYLVLTVDLPLCNSLQKNGVDAINFNHIRVYNWH